MDISPIFFSCSAELSSSKLEVPLELMTGEIALRDWLDPSKKKEILVYFPLVFPAICQSNEGERERESSQSLTLFSPPAIHSHEIKEKDRTSQPDRVIFEGNFSSEKRAGV